jgi:hypothetical protein
MYCQQRLQASLRLRNGDSTPSECRLPVNVVPDTGYFRLVLDNEDIANLQPAITVSALYDVKNPKRMITVRLSYLLLKIASENDADGMRARVGSRWEFYAGSIIGIRSGLISASALHRFNRGYCRV